MKKSLFKRGLNRVLNLVARVCPGSTTLRPLLHRARGVKIGKGVFIGDDVFVDGEYPEMIEIQDGAAISMRATIIAHNKGPGKIIIEKEAFVGPQVVILCNGGQAIRIGEGAVIGAGCVVSRSVPPRTVLMTAPTVVAGYASVSLVTAETIWEFWSGLRPSPRETTKDTVHSVRTTSGDPPESAADKDV